MGLMSQYGQELLNLHYNDVKTILRSSQIDKYNK